MTGDIAVLLLAGLVIGGITAYAVVLRVVPVASLPAACREMVGYLPADIARVADFGSGWGDLAIAMARARPDVQVTGYEISPLPYWVGRLRAGLAGCRNLELRRADFRQCGDDPADLVVCFLDPRVMARTGAVLRDRLSPGSIVMSRGFAIPGWQSFGEVPMKTSPDRLYFYRIA